MSTSSRNTNITPSGVMSYTSIPHHPLQPPLPGAEPAPLAKSTQLFARYRPRSSSPLVPPAHRLPLVPPSSSQPPHHRQLASKGGFPANRYLLRSVLVHNHHKDVRLRLQEATPDRESIFVSHTHLSRSTQRQLQESSLDNDCPEPPHVWQAWFEWTSLVANQQRCARRQLEERCLEQEYVDGSLAPGCRKRRIGVDPASASHQPVDDHALFLARWRRKEGRRVCTPKRVLKYLVGRNVDSVTIYDFDAVDEEEEHPVLEPLEIEPSFLDVGTYDDRFEELIDTFGQWSLRDTWVSPVTMDKVVDGLSRLSIRDPSTAVEEVDMIEGEDVPFTLPPPASPSDFPMASPMLEDDKFPVQSSIAPVPSVAVVHAPILTAPVAVVHAPILTAPVAVVLVPSVTATASSAPPVVLPAVAVVVGHANPISSPSSTSRSIARASGRKHRSASSVLKEASAKHNRPTPYARPSKETCPSGVDAEKVALSLVRANVPPLLLQCALTEDVVMVRDRVLGKVGYDVYWSHGFDKCANGWTVGVAAQIVKRREVVMNALGGVKGFHDVMLWTLGVLKIDQKLLPLRYKHLAEKENRRSLAEFAAAASSSFRQSVSGSTGVALPTGVPPAQWHDNVVFAGDSAAPADIQQGISHSWSAATVAVMYNPPVLEYDASGSSEESPQPSPPVVEQLSLPPLDPSTAAPAALAPTPEPPSDEADTDDLRGRRVRRGVGRARRVVLLLYCMPPATPLMSRAVAVMSGEEGFGAAWFHFFASISISFHLIFISLVSFFHSRCRCVLLLLYSSPIQAGAFCSRGPRLSASCGSHSKHSSLQLIAPSPTTP
ncbi:hypothetical protein OE88DRAFT_1728901 [Heliocybe sulcata]|uniref:Uncharacterized protein n=1 Tax=Heliocybe sulcata TaxID=5364 RepID=A0A5C3MPP0_9AGAM|nr:hypothetical protein OE88DRAFT_1728901 [Heliocybe sulcata]